MYTSKNGSCPLLIASVYSGSALIYASKLLYNLSAASGYLAGSLDKPA
jgi:hypothetical protein